MFKKLIVYVMAAYIAFFPVYRAHAVAPLVIGAAYAVEWAAPHIIRFVASEIVIRSVIKASQVSNAYYSGTSKLANSKFVKHFKGKAALGVNAFAAVLAAIGYSISGDGSIVSGGNGKPDADKVGVAGRYWTSGGQLSDTANGASQKECDAHSYCKSLKMYDSRDDAYYYYPVTESGEVRPMPVFISYRIDCDSNISVSSCGDGYVPPVKTGEPVENSILESELLDHVSKMPFEKQVELMADKKGIIDAELAKDFKADSAPPMPDGQTPIPNIKDPAWENAHLITTGQAQSSNPSKPNYISKSDWDEAYHLANNVANSNTHITGLNSGAIIPDKSGTDTSAGGSTTINIDVSGVESRLDTSNTLTQGVIDEIAKINNSTVALNTTPSDSAKSFWTIKYPDGISGVLTKFISDMKQTPIFKWLNQFVIDVGVGSIPVFDFCFDTIANIDFGCYALTADAYVWTAIKASMILLAVIVSRKIVFGG